MKTTATAKFVRTSSRKVGLVAGLIRGLSASEAQAVLRTTNKAATVPVGKVLASAIANAENNHNARLNDLVVEQILVGPAPTLKRFRARSRGMAASIKKRMSHITVVLNDDKPGASVKPKQTTAQAQTAPAAAKAPAKPAKTSPAKKPAAKKPAVAKSTSKEKK